MLGLQTRRQGDVSLDVSMCSLCCLVILYISALAAILASCVICRHQVGSVCLWWWPGNRANSSEGLEDEGECTRMNTCLALLDWYIFTCRSFHLNYCLICSINAKCSHSKCSTFLMVKKKKKKKSSALKLLDISSCHSHIRVWIGGAAAETWLIEMNHHGVWLRHYLL